MDAKEAAKVLREHNAWRRGEVTNPMPYNAPHEGRTAALSPGVPLDAVVGRQSGDTE